MTRASSVTILDVAKACGVSVATVSRALRDFDNVSPSTIRLVRDVAERLGYRPNQLAAQLRSGSTRAVMVLVPAINDWYCSEILAGVEAVLAEEGRDTFVSVLRPDDTGDGALAPVAGHGRVDGVIAVDLDLSTGQVERLSLADRPLISAGRPVAGACSVTVDRRAIGELAATHLLALGHRRIGVVAGPRAADRTTGAGLRLRAFRSVLDGAGIELDPRRQVVVEPSMAGGAAAAARLVESPGAPTAVFCLSDLLAFGLIQTLTRLGLQVPGDVSVMGVDDHEVAQVAGITTVAQPVAGIGATAARLLLDGPRPGDDVELPVALVARRSTARPAR